MKNGDIIKCDRCNACHRLTTPRSKVTGSVVEGILAFNCCGILRVAAKNGAQVIAGIKVVNPVGITGEAIIHKTERNPPHHPRS